MEWPDRGIYDHRDNEERVSLTPTINGNAPPLWIPRNGSYRPVALRRPHSRHINEPPVLVVNEEMQPHRPLRRPYVTEERHVPPGEQRRPYSAPESVVLQGRGGDDLRRHLASETPPRGSIADPGGAGDPVPKSTLSPDAKPFFPSGYEPAPPPESAADDAMETVALKHITGVMRHLTKHPEHFDTMVKPLVDTFASWLTDEGTVDVVISALLEQSIEQPNFQYSGARLCNMLDRKYPIVFRTSLISKCREEHSHLLQTLNSNPRRLQGFLVFMAELYKQIDLVVSTSKRIVFLGNILLDTMKHLVQIPTHENIKCVCLTLKLVGQDLDHQDRRTMDNIYQQLRELTANPTVTPNVQLLTSSACDLRASNWVHATCVPGHAQVPHQPGMWNDGPVFYGPDGQMLTREESQFLQDSVDSYTEPEDTEDDSYGENEIWEHDEEMDEEIQAAFQQFLMLGKQSTNR